VRRPLAIVLCLALAYSATPAFAFKNVEGCDVVAFAGNGAQISLSEQAWQDYRAAAETILGRAPRSGASLQAWRAIADELIAAQATLLQAAKASPAYQDYLAGDSCRVLTRLNGSTIAALLDEAAQSAPQPVANALASVVEAARTQIDRIERTARFSSNQAKTLMAAQYYCFVAAAIVAFLPPERRAEITLEDFGQTISCKDAGRTG
jgi:hypothetical protein